MLFRCPTRLKLDLNLDPVISPTLFRLGLLFPGHPTTQMFNLWTLTFMDLHFLPSLLKMSSPSLLPSNRILNPTTLDIIPSQNTLKRCVLKPRSILTKRNTRQGQNIIMSTPLGGGHIIFAFSGVRRPTWFPDILGNSSYPIFTKFGMQVYWVNSLYGIAFGDDSSIAN